MLEEHINSSNLTKKAKTSDKSLIYLHTEAYFKIIYHSLCYANKQRDKNNWLEVMGFISGTVSQDKTKTYEIINITKAWPISHGNSVSVTIDDYGKSLNKIMTDLSKTNSTILGWYHSHPSYGLFMSQTDFETQKSYQKMYDKAVALVFDHTIWSSINTGIEAYRLLPDFRTFEKIPIQASNGFEMNLNIPLYHLFMNKIDDNIIIEELDI